LKRGANLRNLQFLQIAIYKIAICKIAKFCFNFEAKFTPKLTFGSQVLGPKRSKSAHLKNGHFLTFLAPKLETQRPILAKN